MKNGQKCYMSLYPENIMQITSITATRVNMITGMTSTSSTGRSSSKWYLSVKEFERRVNAGEIKFID